MADRVTGSFVGPVLGEIRAARFTGEAHADGALLTLVQREVDYACGYQFTRTDRGVFLGTWRDTLGRAGTALQRRCEPPARRSY